MNKIEGSKPDISEYGFIRLYSATVILQGKNPIFENHELEKDLYKYYDKEEYIFLFEDIVKSEDKIFKDSSYLDLNAAIGQGYSLGLLLPLQGSKNLKSIINLSRENASEILSSFNEKQIVAMENLCNEMTEEKNKMNNKTFTKKSSSKKEQI